MSDENKALARRFYDQINAGDYESMLELMDESFVDHEEFPGLPPTREGSRDFFLLLKAAFPDLSMTIDDMLADDDIVAVRGTHKGEFMGISPIGNTITVPMADFVRFKDGKAVEHWGVTDSGAMMQQLGVGGP